MSALALSDELSSRLRTLNAINDLELSRLDVDDVLNELLRGLVKIMEADTAAVLLMDRSGTQLVARAAFGIEVEVQQGVRVSVGRGFAGRVAAERRPVILDRIDSSTVENPLLWEKGITRMLGVPLQLDGRIFGVLHVGRLVERGFDEEDAALLEHVAERIARVVRRREDALERAAARVLQRSLLPSALPQVEGFEFASRYVPAQDDNVGGDWYDAFSTKPGELWVMVGDVAGHGLSAAVVMGRLRSVLRAYALEDHSPGRALELANRKLLYFEPDHTASVVCARIGDGGANLELVVAGHLPPVLALPGERARFIEAPKGMLLGAAQDVNYCPVTLEFPPGAMLVAYTDGLVERRKRSLDVGFEKLLETVCVGEPESVCRQVMEALVGEEVVADDIALLVVRREGT